MKVTVLFFANFKELLNSSSLECELFNKNTVQDICEILASKGGIWSDIFGSPSNSVKIAVNHEMATLSTALSDKDEVAFFPPVTGG
jgi:sulfur-carrier protein